MWPQIIRRILVDHARDHKAEKRGADAVKLSLDEAKAVPEKRHVDLVALDDSLNSLASLDIQQGRIVELRFFGGLSIEETAEVLGASPATVKRDWAMAKAWLYRDMTGGLDKPACNEGSAIASVSDDERMRHQSCRTGSVER